MLAAEPTQGYSLRMREVALRLFFIGDLSVDELAKEALASINRVAPIETNIEIKDMASIYSIKRENILALCDAGINGTLPGEAVTAIAFMVITSDHFEWDWDDEMISEIFSDWSCPEVNYPLTPTTFQMHRRWLLGSETPPERPPLARNAKRGRLISLRRKVHFKGGP
jgi:hypothetical protein